MPKIGKTSRQPKVVSGEGYCRKCQKTLPLDKFYEATNPMIDSNGRMSVCKLCCADIYDTFFSIHNNLEIALRLTCQSLDVCFSNQALKETKSHIEKLTSQGKKADAVFGYYKSKLTSTNNAGIDSFRYKDSDIVEDIYKINGSENNIEFTEDFEIDDDLILFWGKGFNIDDYIFLEQELSNWKQTHKCDNQAETTLLKEICIKILTIRNKRESKESVSSELKELQDLMKTASVDPAKANAASAGKLHDCFGIWIKDIEQFRPAEWFEKQEKYVDMDGFKPYLKNYIARPIKNFLTGTRNFFVDDNIDADLDSVDVGSVPEGDSNG